MANQDCFKLAIDLSRGILVHPKGDPAKVVAFGAAAAVVFVGVTVGHGAITGTVKGGKVLYSGVKGLPGNRGW